MPPVLLLEGAQLTMDWSDLLGGRLHLKRLYVGRVWMREEVNAEGVSLMSGVFSKPKALALAGPVPGAVRAPRAPPPSEPEVAAPSEEPKSSVPVNPPLQKATTKVASTGHRPSSPLLPFGFLAEELLIGSLDATVVNRQAKTRTACSGVRLRISDVDLDPSNLADHNKCSIAISGKLLSTAKKRVGEELQDEKLAEITFEGQGEVHPFDVATGKMQPQARITAKINQGSTFGGSSTIGEAAARDKNFGSLKSKLGIDIEDVKIGGTLQHDVETELQLQNGKAEFLKPVRLDFSDYSASLEAGSWLNGSEDDHRLVLRLLPGEVLTKRILTGVESKLGSGLAKTAESVFRDKDGNVVFEFVSSGRLSKPKLNFGGAAGAIEQLVKGLGGGLLQQLLGN